MGRDAKSIAMAKKKVEYVAEVLKAEPGLTVKAVGTKIHEKFGSRLYYQKLREAFVAAGGRVARRGRPRKQVKGTSGVRAKGRRVARRRKTGRRTADRVAAKAARGLKAMDAYLVVIKTDDKPLVRSVASKEEMAGFVARQLVVGTPLTVIGCYVRQPLAIEFEV
ncbi:MAG: hypothetical protein IT462_15235 [Planctomycetes bacterium]|nr:hypothetical protein [Planctomycetota bacterium]